MNLGYPAIEVVDPYDYKFYPEINYYAKCYRCKKTYKVHEWYSGLYCSRTCEAIQATQMYLIMSVPFDTKYLRRRG